MDSPNRDCAIARKRGVGRGKVFSYKNRGQRASARRQITFRTRRRATRATRARGPAAAILYA